MPGDKLIVVASPGLRPAPRSKPAAWLKELPWVFREQGSGTRLIFERALKNFGLAPKDLNIVLELPSNEAVRSAVISGAGAAALSQLVVTETLRDGVLQQLDVVLPTRRFFVLRHRERSVTRAMQAFSDLLKGKSKRLS